MKNHHRVLLACLVVILGCTARFVADYDEAVHSGASSLETRLNAFFDDLQRTAGTPAGTYEQFASRYEQLYADIEQLQAQAATHARNGLTTTSLLLLDDNLQQLELIHREGLTPAQVPVLRKTFDAQMRMLVQLEVAKKRDGTAPEVSQ